MEQEIVKEVLHNSSDISLWGLFLQADIVVKLVIITLLISSIWSWTIIFTKYAWPSIDVSRRSVEETSASVIKIYNTKGSSF